MLLVIRLLKRPFAWQKKSRVDLGSQTAKKHGFVPIPKRHDMIDTISLDAQSCEARTPFSTDHSVPNFSVVYTAFKSTH